MPKRSADPLVNNLNRVKQCIYRINKSGQTSRAMSLYYSNLNKAGIDIHKPVKLLSEKQREQLFKINESFLKSQTANVRQNKKINAAIGDKVRADIIAATGKEPTDSELNNIYDALTKYHDKDSKLDSMIGTDVIKQANRLISAKYGKDKTKYNKVLSDRIQQASRYATEMARQGKAPDQEVMAAMLKHGSNYKNYI